MSWQEILKYFGYGWIVLVSAILVNFIVKYLGGRTWFDYFSAISKSGIKTATQSLHPLEIIFLFVIYPAIFALIIYLVKR